MESPSAKQMVQFEQVLMESKAALAAHAHDCDPMWAPLSKLVDAFDELFQEAQTSGTEVENLLALKQELIEELEVLSEIDGLTGIWNHRHFIRGLEHELKRAIRSQRPISLLLMEVDFYPEYTQHYGHSAGELCLKRLSGQISRVLNRPYDVVARYAECQFVCMLPETDHAGAMTVAQALFNSVAELDIPHETSEISEVVTISMGLMTRIPDRGDRSEDLTGATEALLEEARAAGRNRSVAADRSTTSA
jgi:diguanylate cyclase (GGDEF)-like protein